MSHLLVYEMRIGIVIPVYNRSNYVSRCLESLMDVQTNEDAQICLVNDGSTDEHIEPLLNTFKPDWAKVTVLNTNRNKGISTALITGLGYLSGKCDLLMILDSDTIVKPDFIEVLLDLKLRFAGNIVSGFNTLTVDRETGRPRHPVKESGSDYCKKATIGGINMLFTVEQYRNFVLSALRLPGHWDWNLCKRFPAGFIVSKPSVVQHIGIDEGLHTSNNPDIATDYDE